MRPRPWITCFVLAASATACGLPPLEYESEHALVGTDQVEQVCAGTLARIDATIEYVDAALGRTTDAEPARIYVIDSEEIKRRCDLHGGGCVKRTGEVFIAWRSFDGALTHEIVHERVNRTPAGWPTALFTEGIACALGKAYSLPSESHRPPSTTEMLGARGGRELFGLAHGYYHAGELTHWLIETQGMAKVLAFKADLERGASPDEVRKTYADHFGRSIDDDLFVHAREDADMTLANLVCTGLQIEPEPERARFRLQADLACDSPRVENLWARPERVFVEWVIRIDEDTRGYWAPVRSLDDDALPPDTMLEIERCQREQRHRMIWTPSRNPGRWLEPGLYRVRWSGPMDGATTLDLELGGPCDMHAQDCEAGERCVDPGVCVPK